MSERASTATSEWVPAPKAFTHRGVRYIPTAVAMYGDMGWVAPFESLFVYVDDTDRERVLWHEHVVLWTASSGRTAPSDDA